MRNHAFNTVKERFAEKCRFGFEQCGTFNDSAKACFAGGSLFKQLLKRTAPVRGNKRKKRVKNRLLTHARFKPQIGYVSDTKNMRENSDSVFTEKLLCNRSGKNERGSQPPRKCTAAARIVIPAVFPICCIIRMGRTCSGAAVIYGFRIGIAENGGQRHSRKSAAEKTRKNFKRVRFTPCGAFDALPRTPP